MSMTIPDVVGHTSFLLTAVSFYVRDMMVLRALAIASGVVGVAYNYWLPAGPLWLPIFWISFFILINAVRIGGIVRDRRSIEFNDDEAELHETMFRNFSPVEFMKLMRIGEWRQAEMGECLVAEGGTIGGLMLLFNGEVVVELDGKEINRARDGAMIGEISFIRGGAATATVTTTTPCRYVFWSGDELRKLLNRNPSMDIAMKHVFSVELTRKLTV